MQSMWAFLSGKLGSLNTCCMQLLGFLMEYKNKVMCHIICMTYSHWLPICLSQCMEVGVPVGKCLWLLVGAMLAHLKFSWLWNP